MKKISLITATLGRKAELVYLLESLLIQTSQDFELVIVDQNPPGFLDETLSAYTSKLDIAHIRSERGLSKARNVGLAQATGDLVAFPDDDCFYEPELLAKCLQIFEENPEIAGLTGVVRDPEQVLSLGWREKEAGLVNKHNVCRRSNSNIIFCTRKAALAINGFDEKMGVGAQTRWGAAEDNDFVLRLVERSYPVLYDPSLIIDHPCIPTIPGKFSPAKGFAYGRGYQHFLLKHRYDLGYNLFTALRTIAGSVRALLSGDFSAGLLLQICFLFGRIQELGLAFGESCQHPKNVS